MIDEIKKTCRCCNEPRRPKHFRKHKRVCIFCEAILGKERYRRNNYYEKKKQPIK